MKNLFILTLLITLIILTGCPDDPVRPDPCDGKKPVSAEFDILESNYWGQDKYYSKSDTILYANIANFVAKEENATYIWKIGSDNREFTTSKVSLRFLDVLGEVPVRLIVNKAPDTLCFPNDDGIDTVTKILYVNRIMENYEPCIFEFDLFSGDYTGYNLDNPKDTFTITIEACYPHHLDIKIFRLINLIPNCEIIFNPSSVSYNGYRQWLFGHEPGHYECLTPRGLAKIFGKNNDSVNIQYNIQQAPGWEYFHKERIKKEFIGVRVK